MQDARGQRKRSRPKSLGALEEDYAEGMAEIQLRATINHTWGMLQCNVKYRHPSPCH